jgi:DNA replication protein DnaC
MAKRARLGRLMEASGLSAETLASHRLDRFHPEWALGVPAQRAALTELVAALGAWAARPAGWRVLCGPYGCGKTHLAAGTALAALEAGHSVYMGTVPDVLDRLRAGFNHRDDDDTYDRRYRDITGAGLLVLDDLGAQYDSPWAAETLWQIVDARYRARRPLLVTTNENLVDPGCRIDPRLRSRLLDGANLPEGWSRVHLLAVGDYRQRTRRDGHQV